MLISTNLHKGGSEVSVKAGSPPASFSFKGRATKHTTVKWSINPPSPVREGMTDDVKMQMMSYNIICAKIVIDSDRCKYHINSSYLSSHIKV